MKHKHSFYFCLLLLLTLLCGVGKNSFGQYVQINDPRYVFPNYSRTTGVIPDYYELYDCRTLNYIGHNIREPHLAIQTFRITTEHIIGVGCSVEIDTSVSQKDWLPIMVYLLKLEQDNQTLSIVDSALIDFFQTPLMTDFSAFDTVTGSRCDYHYLIYEGLFSKEYIVTDSLIVGSRVCPYDDGRPIPPEAYSSVYGYERPSLGFFGEANPHVDTYWWNPRYPQHPRIICRDDLGPHYPIRATACPQVQVHVDSTTSTQAFLSWPAANLASRYRIEYGPAGFLFSTGTHIDDIHDTNYCLRNLLPGVLYDVYVSAYCDTERQYGVPDSVRVMPEDAFVCPTVEDFRLGGSYNYTVWFSWDSIFLQSDYQISVGPAQNAPEANRLINTYANPTYVSTGFEAGVPYAAYIRAQCPHQCAVHDTTLWSPWSEPVYFVLDSNGRVGIPSQMEEAPQFVLTPNPAKDKVAVTLLSSITPSDCTLTLADASGREILRFAHPDTHLQIDLTTLPSGLYLVTLTTPKGSNTQKLVVE